MAEYKSIIPADIAARLKALASAPTSDSRRSNSKSLDRERSNPLQSGKLESEKEQGSHSDNRGDGGSRSGAKEATSLKGDRELSIPPAPPAILPANPFTASSNILQDIAARFNYARETQKVGAWKQLQTDLMNASPFICPVLIPLKDLINIAQDIEKEIKGANTQVGKSNEELLSDFLNGGGDIQIRLDKGDKGSRVEERDKEPTSNTSEVA